LGVEDYLTTNQAAAILGVDERTVYYYARDHDDFPEPKRFGRALMWQEAPLREWRAKHPARPREGT
jgi:predicted DNA-binding transcriptional regulator AlpA